MRSKATWFRAAQQTLALSVLSTISALAVNALRAERMPLIGDFSAAARMTTATGERMDITLEKAEKLFYTHAAVFIDARSREEYANGHIQGGRSLPWQEVDLDFMDVTEELDLETPVITYCDGEACELSHELAIFLRDTGFVNTRVLVNGWSVWQKRGLPIASDPGA